MNISRKLSSFKCPRLSLEKGYKKHRDEQDRGSPGDMVNMFAPGCTALDIPDHKACWKKGNELHDWSDMESSWRSNIIRFLLKKNRTNPLLTEIENEKGIVTRETALRFANTFLHYRPYTSDEKPKASSEKEDAGLMEELGKNEMWDQLNPTKVDFF